MLFQKIHKPQPTNPLYDTNILIFSLLPTIHNIFLQFIVFHTSSYHNLKHYYPEYKFY